MLACWLLMLVPKPSEHWMNNACWCMRFGQGVDGKVVQGPNLYPSLLELVNTMLPNTRFYSMRYFSVIRILPQCQLKMESFLALVFCIPGTYAQVHWAKHQRRQWFMEERANKFDNTISPTCRCCDKGKIETIRHVIQCKSRAMIHEKKKKQFVEFTRQTEMPNDILKLPEGGIDLVLSGRETFRGERWHDTDNIAQNDERITALLEEPSFRVDSKEGIHPTDGDGMGWPMYEKNGNWMEARHREPETLDNKIH